MKILIASSEVTPLAKTGGLADVCGSLPTHVAQLGHDVAVIMPAYRQALASGLPISNTDVQFLVTIGRANVEGCLLKTFLPDSRVPVYLVEQPRYFDRPALYGEGGTDYPDNCERFVFFCRAVMEAIPRIAPELDLVHANDWQTGLIPAYFKTEYRGVPGYERVATLFTIHNLAFQGRFWHWDMLLTGLDWKYFNWRQMEFFGDLNLMKTGLVFADALSTVSPRYAEEIQVAPLGCGLEGVLQDRREVLTGIINGVDYREWNPETDPHLPVRYGVGNWQFGKSECKRFLQNQLGLAPLPDVPLLAFIGRLTEQKGIDLLTSVMREWLPADAVQWVILGTGQPKYHEQIAEMARRNPRAVAARLEFDDPLAHRIEGGADIFLMPSRFEPCGLNQLYSLKYGTVPVVRATGGLADTVTPANSLTLAEGTATAFSFHDYNALSLSETLRTACDAYRDRELWRRLVETGMKQDWSWGNSARRYVDLYARVIRQVRETVSI